MVKSYNELLREVVREMKERNMYHKMVSFKHPFRNLASSARWLVIMIPYYNRNLELEKSFGNLKINVGIENKLTSKEEANRIKTDILFKGMKCAYPDKRNFLSTFSLHYTQLTDDDYKHKNRNGNADDTTRRNIEGLRIQGGSVCFQEKRTVLFHVER